MPALQPFRALRYNAERVPDLGRVIAPPYDVIGPEEQDRLYAASPHNVVRLILGKHAPTDTDADNRYTRARQVFDAWRQEEVLRQDPEPALYLIEQTFAADGAVQRRLGFIALLGLEEPVERAALRHEATLAAPKADRTRLLEAVPANLEPIFCVYPDQDGAIQGLLRAAAGQTPPASTAEWNGGTVRCWVAADPALARDVVQRLALARVLIADGHHRFEVAYANRHRYGAVMSFFVSMADPGLRVRPIHRLVGGTPRPGARDALRALGAVAQAESLSGVLAWLDEGGSSAQGRFGYVAPDGLFKVALGQETLARWLMAPEVPLPLAGLGVSILHQLVLPRAGVRDADLTYAADARHAADAVERGQAACAWLLRGIPLAQVYALASQGLVLPPKSTYFYPKVPSGLAINALGS